MKSNRFSVEFLVCLSNDHLLQILVAECAREQESTDCAKLLEELSRELAVELGPTTRYVIHM